MTAPRNESFIRWQEISRSQLSAVSSLLLTLATALLAFNSALLLDEKISNCYGFWFAIAALFSLSLSVVSALWCAINRLRDFRMTAQIARSKVSDGLGNDALRNQSREAGRFTWCLFWAQTWLFGLGTGCGAIAVLIQIWIR